MYVGSFLRDIRLMYMKCYKNVEREIIYIDIISNIIYFKETYYLHCCLFSATSISYLDMRVLFRIDEDLSLSQK